MDFAVLAILSVTIAFLAALAQAVTGFGFALVIVPLTSLYLDPKVAIAVSLTLGIFNRVPLLIYDRNHVQWRLIAPMAGGAFVGIILGTQLVIWADPRFLRLAIAITVFFLATLLLFNFRWRIGRQGLATAGVGLISGVLTGSTTMGGPPVALFGVNQLWAKESLRANMVAYSTLTFLMTFTMFATLGIITEEVLRLDALMLPGVVLGLLVGNAAFKRVPREVVYRLVVLLVMGSGIVGVVSSLAAVLGT